MSAGTAAGILKVADVAVDPGKVGLNWRLAGLNATPALARPCSNEYSWLSAVALASGITPGLLQVKSTEIAAFALKAVAISAGVLLAVKRSGNLFDGAEPGGAEMPARSIASIGRLRKALV